MGWCRCQSQEVWTLSLAGVFHAGAQNNAARTRVHRGERTKLPLPREVEERAGPSPRRSGFGHAGGERERGADRTKRPGSKSPLPALRCGERIPRNDSRLEPRNPNPLTRRDATLSPPGGEGKGEGALRFMGGGGIPGAGDRKRRKK